MVDRVEKPGKDKRDKDKNKINHEGIGFPRGRVRGLIDELLDRE